MNENGFFAKIDIFLGSLSHEQIVDLAYSLSFLVIFALIFIILCKAIKSKSQLKEVENLKHDEKG